MNLNNIIFPKLVFGRAAVFSLLIAVLTLQNTHAQTTDSGRGHRIVFGFTQNDSLQMKAFLKQLGNIRQEWPEAEIEVVCYNFGLDLLRRLENRFYTQVEDLHNKGVHFIACKNTLLNRKMHHDMIAGFAGWVQAGITEIVLKQEQGWSYIVGGF